MQIEWDGTTYQYDPTKLDVATAMVIRERSGGWGLKTWSQKVDDADPVALQLLLWAILRQNGRAAEPLSLEFSVPDFMAEVARASIEELKAKATAAVEDAEGKKKPRPPRPRSSASKQNAGRTRTSAGKETDTSSSSAKS